MTGFFPTLAVLDPFIIKLIIFVIAAIFGGSNWLGKKMKEARQKRAAEMRPTQMQTGPTAGAGERTSADELAAQRRRQLQELMRKRKGASGGPPPVRATTDPTNLTMAERAERERAKALYAQRAEAMRQKSVGAVNAAHGASGGAHAQPAPTARSRAEAIALARRRQAAAVAAKAKVRQQTMKRQQTQTRTAAPARRDAAPVRAQAQAQAVPVPSISAPLGSGATDVSTIEDSQIDTGESTVYRHVKDIEAVTKDAPSAASELAKRLVRGSIRDVMVLKEILDPPLAMREDSDLPL